MTANSLSGVSLDAVDRTGLLSGDSPGYVSRAFRDCLELVEIKHIPAVTAGGITRRRAT